MNKKEKEMFGKTNNYKETKQKNISYGVEEHSGGSMDVGIIIKRFRNKEAAKQFASNMRKKNKQYGYRIFKR